MSLSLGQPRDKRTLRSAAALAGLPTAVAAFCSIGAGTRRPGVPYLVSWSAP